MQITSFKNHLLIAMPSVQGEFFAKSVVYIHEHSAKEGTIGFTINKPLSATLGNVMEHLTIKMDNDAIYDAPVFSGGPVGPDQGFVIHDCLNLKKSKNACEDVMVSTTREILVDIASGNGPSHFMVTLGYASWEPGQLEKEIQHNDWLLAPFKDLLVFETPIAERWITAGKLLGVDMSQLSSQVGHA